MNPLSSPEATEATEADTAVVDDAREAIVASLRDSGLCNTLYRLQSNRAGGKDNQACAT